MKFACLLILFSLSLCGETGEDAWLRYRPVKKTVDLPATIVSLDNSEVAVSAQHEMQRGIKDMTGRTERLSDHIVNEDMIVLAALSEIVDTFPELTAPGNLISDGYWIRDFRHKGTRVLLVGALNDRGILYGSFDLLRHLMLGVSVDRVDEINQPSNTIRWVNEWDNLDGTIERGYAGRSIFFVDGNVRSDLTRASEYARLLASIGINGCAVNNVNANPRVLSPEFLPQLVRLAAAFRPWGVQLSLSVPFNSPKTAGNLDTFDPEDERVKYWWKLKVNGIYKAIPDFGGFVVKADSEGQLGPSTYGRSHAQAANVLANALRPHGGIVIYRGFVYNHHLDWRNLKNDRARAAYDNFHDLDGKFADNAILQVKYGPIDFQTREPVSPLLGELGHTKTTLELQITQEYTGQQRHLCYLVPMWKELLDFDLRVDGKSTPLRQRVSGLVGVSNVGMDKNWLASDLAMANLYGFGRLAWNPTLDVKQITEDWVRMTWGQDPEVVRTVSDLELGSWETYESYTGPLGGGTLTDILHGHYGPGIETAEGNGWGQWIRADGQGIGMDRTVATGTGFIGQYSTEVAALYESLERCPDELLLFMHHVPYSYKLHSGKSLIQHIYDSHYQGAETAAMYPQRWQTLEGKLDPDRFAAVLKLFQYQAGHAIVWRDAICNWFQHQSGIPDRQGRVGTYPGRIEAEAMQLQGYKVVAVAPWEDASNGRAISCPETSCTATWNFAGVAGWYKFSVQYFDTTSGNSQFQVLVGEQLVDAWQADGDLPGKMPNGDTSTRRFVGLIALRPGDKIQMKATPNGTDQASFDYLEISAVQ